MNRKRIALLGGDARSAQLYCLLAADGQAVSAYALEAALPCADSLAAALDGADFAVGPVPLSQNGLSLFTPLSDKCLPFPMLRSALGERRLFCGAPGQADKSFAPGQLCDLLALPEMAFWNAVPTAEGAILLALQERHAVLLGSRCLVIGYGRIGKVLADRLLGWHAPVTVAARRPEDRALAAVLGCASCSCGQEALLAAAAAADIIFNTVPMPLLNEEILSQISPGCVIIDLASRPFGVDYPAAKRLGVKAICAQSLPGKVAPVSAAYYLRMALYHLMEAAGQA